VTEQNSIPPVSLAPPPAPADAHESRRVHRAVVVFLVVVLTIAALVFFTHLKPLQPSRMQTAAEFRGKPAPDFALTDLSGKTVHLSDYRGKAVVLNFWATWCPPCVREIPTLVEMQKQYGPQGLEIVGVAMDDDATPASIGRFAREANINYTLLIGSDKVSDLYGGVEALPTTFYIDRDGRMVERVFGAGERSDIEDNVKKALAAAGAGAQQVEHGASN